MWQRMMTCGLWCLLLTIVQPADATLIINVENPTPQQQVSGISLISGWAFSTITTTSVSVVLRVDKQAAVTPIPCCTNRVDVVTTLGPGTPVSTGFGLLVNYSNLTAGSHTLSLEVSAPGEQSVVIERQVSVVKPGEVDFVTFFGFAGANVAIDGNELLLAGVRVGIGDSPPRATLRVNYAPNSQSLVIGQAASANPARYTKVQEVFSNCTFSGGCHGSDNPQAGLRLSTGASFTNLVAVRSTEVPHLLRVNPGKPEESYLLQKIERANPPLGGQMPLGGPPLTAEQIDIIRQWILTGAAPPS